MNNVLYLQTEDRSVTEGKAQAAAEMVHKLSSTSTPSTSHLPSTTKTVSQPSTKQSQRIAQIFAARFSS